ncbi:MAG: type II toxin-antitoxin system VapC family toxin [bacterium]|nr:type II toxin-antitoxin system VapC family toxin [bacterium]
MKRDQWTEKAMKAALTDVRLVTSSLVVSETAALLQVRGHVSAAIAFLQDARASQTVQLVTVDAALQAEAWNLFYRWAGMGANPVDCASFAIMHRFGIRKAFTFDQHFRAAGFETLD